MQHFQPDSAGQTTDCTSGCRSHSPLKNPMTYSEGRMTSSSRVLFEQSFEIPSQKNDEIT